MLHTARLLVLLAIAWIDGPPAKSGLVASGGRRPQDRPSFDQNALAARAAPISSTRHPAARPPVSGLSGSAPPAPAVVVPTEGLAAAPPLEGLPEPFAELNKRRTSVEKYGGSQESVAAVDAALEWLIRHQRTDGLWSLSGNDPLAARYSRGAATENHEAATGMALLALVGAGHTHQTGRYRTQVDKAVRAVLQSQDLQGSFFRGKSPDEWMYTQALCTKALCDLYAATSDAELRDPCRKAVEFCLGAQGAAGGWRYRPKTDSDTSVTGWMVLALHSAKDAGLDVPQANLDRVGKYLDSAAAGPTPPPRKIPAVPPAGVPLRGSRYGYMPGDDIDNPVMTAEGLLCRIHLGWRQDDPRLAAGVRYLLEEHAPEWRTRDVYYWFNATQALHHLGGTDWKTWNEKLRDVIVKKQEQAGAERGSWDPLTKGWPRQQDGADTWAMNNAGGRLYVTCFTTYILETYYQKPLYPEK